MKRPEIVRNFLFAAVIILHSNDSFHNRIRLLCSTLNVCAADESTAAIPKFRYPREKFDNVRCSVGRPSAEREGTFNPLCSASPNDRSLSPPWNASNLSIHYSSQFHILSSKSLALEARANQWLFWSGRRTMMFHPTGCRNKGQFLVSLPFYNSQNKKNRKIPLKSTALNVEVIPE